MSFLAKRELLARVAPSYQSAPPKQKSVILDEFVAVTGYDRKYAIRLLAHPIPVPLPLTRPRERFYGRAVQDALVAAWTAANRICAKRLVALQRGVDGEREKARRPAEGQARRLRIEREYPVHEGPPRRAERAAQPG